jgi:hypothetical protein
MKNPDVTKHYGGAILRETSFLTFAIVMQKSPLKTISPRGKNTRYINFAIF